MRTFLLMLVQTPRALGFVFLMMIVATATMTRAPADEPKEHKSAWGSNSSTGSSRAYSAKSSYNSGSNSYEASERARDEAFRRQMIREMREEYEAENGPVDMGN